MSNKENPFYNYDVISHYNYQNINIVIEMEIYKNKITKAFKDLTKTSYNVNSSVLRTMFTN